MSMRCIFLSGPMDGRFMRVPDHLDRMVVPIKPTIDHFHCVDSPLDPSACRISTTLYYRVRRRVFVHESEV